MGTTIATHLVVPALAAFNAHYPNIQIEIDASDRTADLASENIDCVIRGGDLRDSSLIARCLGSVEFVTYAAPAYLAAREPLCHPSQLENTHPVVRYVFPSSGKHNRVEFVRGDEQIVIDGNYVAVNDSNGYLAAGLAGLGVLHTLRFMVQSHLDSGELVPVLEDWWARANTLSVVYMPNRHLSVRVRAFVDWPVECFATHPHVMA
ncbi:MULTISPECIES: LysR substrate-binding domain-containing protein [Pseudomonas]|uniref:LysR substrate-binding domain-containing protein n=1 Tax=Pseudomonas TaxID=286 RepID=UPI0010235BEE|nr:MULTISPECIES: LysR substrate-binding domain-containing protein [Pseudomonas]MDO4235306.1 LysR substrate-binding domain-containing protein [Pseudomonas sp.]RZI20166.1 hypothetical protein EUX53_19670 [Pseudomonas orientalis]